MVVDGDGIVRGVYALAAGAVSHELATRKVRRNRPDPVLVLGRLAVDRRAQGMHLGAALLQDAVGGAHAVAAHAGVRGAPVHALRERAKAFSEHYGFQGSPLHPLTLMLPLPSLDF